MIVLIVGIVFTSLRDRANVSREGFNTGAGVRALIFSTIGYTLYTVIVNSSGVNSKAVFLPQSVGMVIGACSSPPVINRLVNQWLKTSGLV